jgi:hypothetical protein
MPLLDSTDGGKIFSGFCCAFTACDFNDINLCLHFENEVW